MIKTAIESRDSLKKEYESAIKEIIEKYEKQIKFMKTPRTLKDFKVGLEIFGKLRPVQIEGGTLLVETTYKMH